MCSLIATKHIHISSQFAILTLYSIFGWYMLTKRATISFLCYILMVITVLVLQMQSGTAFSPSRESSMLSQRHKRHDELPGTWYKQYAEKFRTLHGKFRPDDKEMPKRTPEGMSDYLKVCSVHKRKRTVFMDKQGPNIMLENGEFSNLTDDRSNSNPRLLTFLKGKKYTWANNRANNYTNNLPNDHSSFRG